MKTFVLLSLCFGIVCNAKDLGFSGDRAKALHRQMQDYTSHSEGTNDVADGLTCEEADIMGLVKGDMNAPLYPFRYIGCSNNPKIAPSALEAFILMPDYLSYSFMYIPLKVENRRLFKATKLSCVHHSDRCTLTVED